MGKIYSVLMNKGGVGKTSLVINLAASLAEKYPDKKVLIIDADGQANATMSFSELPREIYSGSISDVLIGEAKIEDVILEITSNLHIVASNDDMNYLEMDVLQDPKRFPRPDLLLKNTLGTVRDTYDYIFIDAPPTLGLIAVNILNVADSVLVPFVPELYAVRGLRRVIEAIQDFQEHRPDLELGGIVGMMVDARTRLHLDMLREARNYCDQKGFRMFRTMIPRSIKFANAIALEAKPAVWASERTHYIVAAYEELLEELLSVGTEKA